MRLNPSSGRTRRDDRFSQSAQGWASRRTAMLAFEALEDRTLLSYATAANNLHDDLAKLAASLATQVADAVPLVGSQLKGLLPVQQLLGTIDSELSGPLSAATDRNNLRDRLNDPSVFGLLLSKRVEITPLPGGSFSVAIPLATDLGNFNATPQVDLGLGKFLTFKTSGGLNLDVKFQYLLQFTIQPSGAAALDGPSLGLIGLPSASLGLTVTAGLTNFKASGTLTGLLHAEVTQAGTTSFIGTFGATVAADGSATVALVGSAEATLGLALSFVDPNDAAATAAAVINPKLTTTLHVGWSFDAGSKDSNPAAPQGSFGRLTDLSFRSLQLDVGVLLPKFLTSIIDSVQKITKPLQPIVDFFEADVPELDKVGIHLSLSTLIDPEHTSALVKVLDLINFINNDLPSPSGGGSIRLGDFSFNDPRTTLQSVLDANTSGLIVPAGIPTPSDLLQQADSGTGGFFSSAMSGGGVGVGGGFSFPIVTDPRGSAWQLLAGGNPDLVRFTLPPVDKHAEGIVGAGFGVFDVFLEAAIDLHIGLTVAYDTQGVRDFIGSGDLGTLVNGFYVDNTKDSKGNPISGITLMGRIDAGASLLGVTLSGGITANGKVHLDDSFGPKARIGAILNTSFGSIFQAEGTIDASLDLSYGFDLPVVGRLDLFRVNLASVTLLDFNTALHGKADSMAAATDVITISPRDNERLVRVYHQEVRRRLLDHDHEFLPDSSDSAYQSTEEIIVDYGDRRETYPIAFFTFNVDTDRFTISDAHPYHLLLLDGSALKNDHTVIVEPDVYGEINNLRGGRSLDFDEVPINAILIGGGGNDDLEYRSSGKSFLVGGGGSNTLIGGNVEYGNYFSGPHLELPSFNVSPTVLLSLLASTGRGGEGHNVLKGGPVLVGGPAGNTFELNGTGDTVYGGAGDDSYQVSGFANSAHDFTIHGNGGTDSLIITVSRRDQPTALVIGASSAQREQDPAHAPISITDPSENVSITAEGLSKISDNGLSGSISVQDLSATTLQDLQLDLQAVPLLNTTPVTVPNKITIAGGSTEDDFVVQSEFVGRSVGGASSTPKNGLLLINSFGHEATTVQDRRIVKRGANKHTISTLIIGIDEIDPQDTLVLKGGGGGDIFDVGLDISTTFAVDVQDTPNSGNNELFVNGEGFTFGHARPIGSSRPTAGPGGLFGLSDYVEDGAIAVSSFGVSVTSNLFQISTGTTLSESARVTFDNNVKKLEVNGANAGNAILVGFLYVPDTTIFAGKGGDTFDVQGVVGNLHLYGGIGNDTFNIPGDFHGDLTVDGQGGADVLTAANIVSDTGTLNVSDHRGLIALNIDDSSDTKARDVKITPTKITGFAFSFINYEPTELSALNIIGSRGYRPGFLVGRLFVLPRGNTYGVLGTPGLNTQSELVKTTLTVLGAVEGDTVSVLAASDVHLRDKGVQGTLQIISPYHLTDLFIYGYVVAADARAAGGGTSGGGTSRTAFKATGKQAQTQSKAVQRKADALFASLLHGTKTARRATKTAPIARSPAGSKPAIVRNGRSLSGGLAPITQSPRFNRLTGGLTPIANQPPRFNPLTGGLAPIANQPPAFNPLAGGSTVGHVTFPIVIDSDHVSGLTPGDIQYGADELTSLTVTTPAGGQVVNVVGTPNQGAVGSITTTLIGHGNDSVYVGGPSLSRVQGTLNVTNPPSRTTLIVDGSGDSAKQDATISPGLIRGLAPADVTYEVGDVNTIDLRGGTGGNRFHVVATRFGSPVSIDGGSGANTLVGPDLANTWKITSNDAGYLGNLSFPALGGPAQRDVTFKRIGSLTGGSLADTFHPTNGANLSGRIDGGAGINTLDLSAQTRNVAVDLRTGVATGIKGGVANIANVNGGRGTNVLVGDANPNVLQGGSGRNLLIGGGGVDQLSGGLGGNILIGGGVTADLTLSALDSIMAEFARTDEDFLTRLTHILSGNGTNDPAYLNPATVVNDGAANVLTGGIGPNWFFAPDALSPKGRKSGDVVTLLR